LKRLNQNKLFILPKVIISFVSCFLVIFLTYIVFYISKNIELFVYYEDVEELPKTGEDDYRVFITSGTYNGDLGTIRGADRECDTLAGYGMWYALLTETNDSSFSRIPARQYYSFDGSRLLVDLRNGVSDNSLIENINQDENNNILDGRTIWTGISRGAAFTCNDWVKISEDDDPNVPFLPELYAGYGSNTTRGDWYDKEDFYNCNQVNHLYCFEIYKDRDEDYYPEDRDCNDRNSTVYPGALEICDGLDNNCDGSIPQAENDNDQDGYRTCSDVYGDCNDSDPNIHPQANERCNNIDDNCDGVIPETEIDNDGDSYSECNRDCNDRDASINPSSSENCDNIDNDCDNLIDEDLQRQCGTDSGICTRGYERCTSGNWANCDGVMPQQEICDGMDNNCNGNIDEGCSCEIGATQECGSNVGKCRSGTQWCEGNVWGECLGQINPSYEICDGIDNDCDNATDENLRRNCGSNIGECKQGIQYCANGSWGICENGTNANQEVCDGKDNDCNGILDEGCECTSNEERDCGVSRGNCQTGKQKCINGTWSGCEGGTISSEEICDDFDNDCDGETDEGYICEEESQVIEEKEEKGKELNENLNNISDKINLRGIKEFFSKSIIIIILIIFGLISVFIILLTIKYINRRKEIYALERFKSSKSEKEGKERKESPLA